jgi:hypothetical protein
MVVKGIVNEEEVFLVCPVNTREKAILLFETVYPGVTADSIDDIPIMGIDEGTDEVILGTDDYVCYDEGFMVLRKNLLNYSSANAEARREA